MTDAERDADPRFPGFAAWHLRSRSLSILNRTLSEVLEDRIPVVAAGVTFFVLLAIFPAIASVMSLYGLFADRASIAHVLDSAAVFIPGGALATLDAELHRLIVQPPGKLDIGFAIGLIVATWSASGGLKSLADGLNVAYEIRETRSFARMAAHMFLLTIAGIALATGLAAVAALAPEAMRHFPAGTPLVTLIAIVRWPFVYVACVLMIDVLYRIGPDRAGSRWQWFSWGSSVSAALWLAGSFLFTWYAGNFGTYDRVYGGLGAIVGFLTWIWLSVMILLAGAELNREIERDRDS